MQASKCSKQLLLQVKELLIRTMHGPVCESISCVLLSRTDPEHIENTIDDYRKDPSTPTVIGNIMVKDCMIHSFLYFHRCICNPHTPEFDRNNTITRTSAQRKYCTIDDLWFSSFHTATRKRYYITSHDSFVLACLLVSTIDLGGCQSRWVGIIIKQLS